MKKSGLVCLSCCLLLAGCAALQQLIQKPTVVLDKTDLKNVSFTEGTVLFHFLIHNPNPVGIVVSKATYRLALNGTDFIQGVLDKGIAVAANGTAPLEIPLTIVYLDFYKTLQDLFKSDKAAYHLNGSLSVGPFDIPYRASGDLPLPKLPDVSLKNVKVARWSTSGASLVFSLAMNNPNAFTVQPEGIRYRVALAGVPFAEGDAVRIPSALGNGESSMDLPLTVNFIEMGKAAYNLLLKSSSAYDLSGDIRLILPRLGPQQLPFRTSGNVAIAR